MNSVRFFIRLWAAFALAIVTYAGLDRVLNPWLRSEQSFSMEPDLTRLPDLAHWGGRLMQQNLPLLALNALVLGGLLSLAVQTILERMRRRPSVRDIDQRISVFVTEARPSSPPPA